MLIEASVFYKREKDYQKIRGIIDRVCNRLDKKRGLLAHAAFKKRQDKGDVPFLQILICARSEYDFETARTFLYWGFEDYRRKHGFCVRYEIKHIRMDPPGLGIQEKRGEDETD